MKFSFSLLELGFEDFIRVGSVKKIAKPILPYRYGKSLILQEFKGWVRSIY